MSEQRTSGTEEQRDGQLVSQRRATAAVNVAAIERNCARLRAELSGSALCVVVKADGYGHGAVQSARAALAGGASWLAVAAAREAVELRAAGIRDVRVLVMGALSDVELAEALAADADVVVWHEQYVEAVARAGGGRVHVKLDSGMGRLGTREPAHASAVVEAAASTSGIELAGVMTHFATADELDDEFFGRQLDVFTPWARGVAERHSGVLIHAANSAATLRERAAHFDMVRCGIAVYGMDPFGVDPAAYGLEPALELSSYVAEVKGYRKGDSAGYGRRWVAEHDTYLGVLPIGYGDGWRRGLSNNADVLIGGRRRKLVGTVSMDNITVELAAAPAVGVDADTDADTEAQAQAVRGEQAVLVGAQGDERITAEEVAGRLGTINYEVTCGLTGRVGRVYHRDGVAQ